MLEVINLSVSRVPARSLPPGRRVVLPGRGTTFAYELDGPPDAPVLFLLHGLAVTAYLNWFPAFPALQGKFRVVAMDHRGHGRGIQSHQRFRLEDCADDVAALADALGIERFVPVGYSLGGPIAQLIWRCHRERVEGLVFCATSRNFGGTARERYFYSTVVAAGTALRLSRRAPRPIGRRSSARQEDATEATEAMEVTLPGEDGYLPPWALAEMRRGKPEALLQAMSSMGRFTSHRWVGEIDVPTAVVVSTRDRFIAADRQLKLARAIPGATLHPVPTGHAACVLGARRFVPVLVEACESVASRLQPAREPS